MKISPNELNDNGFQLIDKLEHNELPSFLKKYLNRWTLVSIVFYTINILLFIPAVILFILNLNDNTLGIFDWFYHYFIGFTIAFLLVPLHEYIHVLAYRSQGAINTSYDANLKKFYFLALADRFVANRKEFTVVALAPFVIISSILFLLLTIANYNWSLTILGILFTHTSMSSGDFALLSYFEYHKDKVIVTYDDVKEKSSYFYGLLKDGN